MDLKRIKDDARNGDLDAIKQLITESSRKQLDECVLDVFLGIKQIESWHKEAQTILKNHFRKNEVWLFEDRPEKHWLIPLGWNVHEIKVAQRVCCQLYDDHTKLYGPNGKHEKKESPIILTSATTLAVKSSSIKSTGLGEYGDDSRYGLLFWLPENETNAVRDVKIEITMSPHMEWLEANLKRKNALQESAKEWAEKTKAETPPNDRPPGFDPDDTNRYTFKLP